MHCSKEQRFWNKVTKAGDNDCWLWVGAKRGSRQKRGCFWDGGKNVDAARWIWRRTSGLDLGAGSVVMHTCDNSLCVNPAHLRVGTQAENVADMWAKGRQNLDAIRSGAALGRDKLAANPHLRARGSRHGIHKRNVAGENNPFAKLDADKVRQIRALAGTMNQYEIAAKFNVHQAAVWRVIHGKAWTHVC